MDYTGVSSQSTSMIEISKTVTETSERKAMRVRKSLQPLIPQRILTDESKPDQYNVYPCHSLGKGKIFNGYLSLAQWIAGKKKVIVDGYSGVLWSDVHANLHAIFTQLGTNVQWIFASDYVKPTNKIDELVQPFLGTEDSVWGKRCPHSLADFFKVEELQAIKADKHADCTIVLGAGAALCNWDAPVVYLDVPKNEIQYRMRAGSITNLGARETEPPASMYKRFYFVDWVVQNKHKKSLLQKITVLGDVQWKDDINWAFSSSIKDGLDRVSKTMFRVRPWFEAGAWGGQWMKEHIDEINKEEVNYAWSFELIVPENGLVFESDGNLLELSFDFLMFQDARSVVGQHADFFGDEFPIRFDFLDTWDGGNLSIQCHPRLSYIREHFGERITQDETYYILDCQGEANVYLGFQKNVDPGEFRKVLEDSKENDEIVEVEKYVQSYKAAKHDLFLIPNGTIHSAGKDNLVLEISSTPYIFTFKMYDWLRLDLNGEPRAINIEHAFNNLRFDYSGDYVKKALISKPKQIRAGQDWEIFHLPTHPHHFYDVHRVEFDSEIVLETADSCNVMMLVEGSSVTVQVDGEVHIYQYAETFVIPAAANEYTLVNNGSGRAKVVKAFIKDSIDQLK
jgi:mannose-6-phosphate isomerase class I